MSQYNTVVNEPPPPPPFPNTSDIIYETYRQRRVDRKHIHANKSLFSVSLLIAFASILTVFYVIYDQYTDYYNGKDNYLNATSVYCHTSRFGSIDTVTVTIASIILLVFISVYKRRVLLVGLYKFQNIGLPMLVSVWNKTDRLNTMLIYGLISQNVFQVVANSLLGDSNGLASAIRKNVNDPTGLLLLFAEVFEVLLLGISKSPDSVL